MPWPKTGATQYHTQLGTLDKGRSVTESPAAARNRIKGYCENQKICEKFYKEIFFTGLLFRIDG